MVALRLPLDKVETNMAALFSSNSDFFSLTILYMKAPAGPEAADCKGFNNCRVVKCIQALLSVDCTWFYQ